MKGAAIICLLFGFLFVVSSAQQQSGYYAVQQGYYGSATCSGSPTFTLYYGSGCYENITQNLFSNSTAIYHTICLGCEVDPTSCVALPFASYQCSNGSFSSQQFQPCISSLPTLPASSCRLSTYYGGDSCATGTPLTFTDVYNVYDSAACVQTSPTQWASLLLSVSALNIYNCSDSQCKTCTASSVNPLGCALVEGYWQSTICTESSGSTGTSITTSSTTSPSSEAPDRFIPSCSLLILLYTVLLLASLF